MKTIIILLVLYAIAPLFAAQPEPRPWVSGFMTATTNGVEWVNGIMPASTGKN